MNRFEAALPHRSEPVTPLATGGSVSLKPSESGSGAGYRTFGWVPPPTSDRLPVRVSDLGSRSGVGAAVTQPVFATVSTGVSVVVVSASASSLLASASLARALRASALPCTRSISRSTGAKRAA